MNEEQVNELEYIDVNPETVYNDADEFVNDDNAEAFKLLNLKAKMGDINAIIDDINSKQNEVLQCDDDISFIDERLESLTEDEIGNMSGEKLDQLLTDEDGKTVEFSINFNGNKKALYQFKKDFLIMRKQSNAALKTFDAEIAKINEEIAASQEEFDRLVNNFGNVSNLIRYTLQDKLDSAETDEKKQLINKLITSFDNAKTLDNVKEYCKSYRGKNILSDFKFDKNSTYVYRRYLKVIKTFGIKTDLTKFNFLEKRFLANDNNKYEGRDNIFVFAVIHYISSWHNKAYTKADGLFLTQFTIMLKNLFYNKFDSEQDRAEFINNIIDVIKIIG